MKRGRFVVVVHPREVTAKLLEPIKQSFSNIEFIGADEIKGYLFLEADSPEFIELLPGEQVPWYGTTTYRNADHVKVEITDKPQVIVGPINKIR